MDESFDGYRKWLGIPPEEQPPHHYRLLGIAIFEDDPDVIENAANRQMTHVRTFQSGRYSKLSQTILNQLSTAKICLLNADKKSSYDNELKAKMRTSERAASPPPKALPPQAPPANQPAPPAPVASPPAAPPVGSPLPMGSPLPPMGSPLPSKDMAGNAAFGVATSPMVTPKKNTVGVSTQSPPFAAPNKTTKSVGQRARSRRKSSPWPMLFGIVAVVALLGVVIVVVNQKPKVPADQSQGDISEAVPADVPFEPPSAPRPNRQDNALQTQSFPPPDRLPIDMGGDDFQAAPPKKRRKEDTFENAARQEELFRATIEAAMRNIRIRNIEEARRELERIRQDDIGDKQLNQMIRTSQIIFSIEDIAKAAYKGASRIDRKRMEGEEASFKFGDSDVTLLGFEEGRIAYTVDGDKVETLVTKIPTMDVLAFASLDIDIAMPEIQAKVITFLLLDHLSTEFERRLANEWAERLWNENYSDDQLRWVVETFGGDQRGSDQPNKQEIQPDANPRPTAEGDDNPAAESDDPGGGSDNPFGVGKPGENPFDLDEPNSDPAKDTVPDGNPFF